MSFIKTLNAWRVEQKGSLHTGKMVKPWPIKCDKLTLTHEDGNGLTVDAILTSAFEADGYIYQYLVNYTTENRTATLPEEADAFFDPRCCSKSHAKHIELAPLSVALIRRNA